MSSGKLNNIEAARGFAAFIVVFYHGSRHFFHNTGEMPYWSSFQFGHAGVDFFFVLSGFIILHIHNSDIGKQDRLLPYAIKRLIRIYPIFWIVFLMYLSASIASGNMPHQEFSRYILDIFLLPLPGDSVVGVSWTLRHEILFYSLFAVLIINRNIGIFLAILWGSFIVSKWIGLLPGLSGSYLGLIGSTYNLQFFMGMGVALLLRHSTVPWAPHLLALGLVSFLITAVLENMHILDGYADPARIYYGVSASITLWGLVEVERQGLISAPNWLTRLGAASYSIYLIHLFGSGVINKVWEFSGLSSLLSDHILFLAIVAAGVVVGILLSVYIEQPLLRLLRQKLSLSV